MIKLRGATKSISIARLILSNQTLKTTTNLFSPLMTQMVKTCPSQKVNAPPCINSSLIMRIGGSMKTKAQTSLNSLKSLIRIRLIDHSPLSCVVKSSPKKQILSCLILSPLMRHRRNISKGREPELIGLIKINRVKMTLSIYHPPLLSMTFSWKMKGSNSMVTQLMVTYKKSLQHTLETLRKRRNTPSPQQTIISQYSKVKKKMMTKFSIIKAQLCKMEANRMHCWGSNSSK